MNLNDDPGIGMLRVPPHSIEAETSVLGGLLLDNSAWDRIGDMLKDSDFYRHEHQLVFGAVGSLVNSGRQADIVTVYSYLQAHGKADEVGGMVYLNALAQYVPSAANIRRYAEIVRDRSLLRGLITASDEIATSAFNTEGKEVAAILDEAERKIGTVREAGASTVDEWERVDTGVVRALDRIQERSDGTAKADFIPTGLKDLDERLDGGMRPGDVIVIGARSGMGKSALSQTIAEHVALAEGLPVAIFSLEMSRDRWVDRFLASIGKIHLTKIRRPERLSDFDWSNLTNAVEKLRRSPIEINDQGGLNINQLRSKARAVKRKHGKLGLIVVDHMGLTTGTDRKANRNYQVAEVSGGMKSLAKELGCPAILLVQISRTVDSRDDPMPKLADLRDSGDIENDADIVVFVHRPIKNSPTLSDEWKNYAKVSVAKLRDGEPGYMDLYYVGENLHFVDWPATLEVPSSRVRTSRGGDL